MAAPPPPQPTRFAVQRPKKGGWKTLFVDERLEAAEQTLKALIRANARGCFRLVRLDHNPEARFDGLEFNWKLIALHAPHAGHYFRGLDPTPSAPPLSGAPRGTTSAVRGAPGAAAERVRVPFGIYALVTVLGALLAVVLWLAIGNPQVTDRRSNDREPVGLGTPGLKG